MKATTVNPGQRFARWQVLREANARKGHRLFECRCECGTERVVSLSALKSGVSGSCGCLRKEVVTTHGNSWREQQTSEWRTWVHMRARCRSMHKNYGGRGIEVCRRWDESFEAFLADMGPKPPGTSIDRIDNEGNYESGNCRWTTMRRQLRNQRRNVWVWYKGHRCLLVDAAIAEGFHVETARMRKKRGWPDARLFDPVNPFYANRPQCKKQ